MYKVLLYFPSCLFRKELTVLVCALLSISLSVFCDEDIIQLQQGHLRGHRLTTRKGREIFAFQGIPYAQPPVGELRFKV